MSVSREIMILSARIEPYLLRSALFVPPLGKRLIGESGQHKAVTGHVVRQVAYIVNPVTIEFCLVGAADKINMHDSRINLRLDGIAHLLTLGKKSCS